MILPCKGRGAHYVLVRKRATNAPNRPAGRVNDAELEIRQKYGLNRGTIRQKAIGFCTFDATLINRERFERKSRM